MKKETWLIEARDPLIARDGRPFDNAPGARAASLSFPFPSTTTGGVRTRAGIGFKSGRLAFDAALSQAVRNIAVRGPLLAELKDDDTLRFLAPAPADALLLNTESVNEKEAHRVPLVPLTIPADASSNLPTHVSLVGMKTRNPNKPHGNAPRFWYWEQFEAWLLNPQEGIAPVKLAELGHSGLTNEQRTHVRIDYRTKANDEGGLFQTRGLEFTHTEKSNYHQTRHRLTLALEVETPDEFDDKVAEGLAPLGGERRVVSWRSGSNRLPSVPSALRYAITQSKHCRLILLTPAHFESGYEPTWLQRERDGVKAEVKAIAVNRTQVISGWNFETKRPKPTRRLTPAGTVLFVELKGDDAKIASWVDKTWMQCVSDIEQDRNDGFGLAALGIWGGTYYEVK